MAEEEVSLQINTFFWVIFVIFSIAIIAIVFFLMFPFEPAIYSKQAPRAAVEISENFFASPLTTSKAVFSSSELDKIKDSNAEPFVRHCSFGYMIGIESEGRRWEFGFRPTISTRIDVPSSGPMYVERRIGFLNEYRTTMPVSVDEKPGTMSIAIYEDSLTDITCLVQRAYTLKQEERMPCKLPSSSSFQLPKDVREVTCKISLEKIGDDLCASHPDFSVSERGSECRSLPGTDVQKFSFKEASEKTKAIMLVAYPLKNKAGAECGKITNDMIAGNNDDVGIVVLCVKEVTDDENQKP